MKQFTILCSFFLLFIPTISAMGKPRKKQSQLSATRATLDRLKGLITKQHDIYSIHRIIKQIEQFPEKSKIINLITPALVAAIAVGPATVLAEQIEEKSPWGFSISDAAWIIAMATVNTDKAAIMLYNSLNDRPMQKPLAQYLFSRSVEHSEFFAVDTYLRAGLDPNEPSVWHNERMNRPNNVTPVDIAKKRKNKEMYNLLLAIEL